MWFCQIFVLLGDVGCTGMCESCVSCLCCVNMSMYVLCCMCVSPVCVSCVEIYIMFCVCIFMCMCVYVCACVCMCVYLCVSVCMCVYVCICVCVYVWMCSRIEKCASRNNLMLFYVILWYICMWEMCVSFVIPVSVSDGLFFCKCVMWMLSQSLCVCSYVICCIQSEWWIAVLVSWLTYKGWGDSVWVFLCTLLSLLFVSCLVLWVLSTPV